MYNFAAIILSELDEDVTDVHVADAEVFIKQSSAHAWAFQHYPHAWHMVVRRTASDDGYKVYYRIGLVWLRFAWRPGALNQPKMLAEFW